MNTEHNLDLSIGSRLILETRMRNYKDVLYNRSTAYCTIVKEEDDKVFFVKDNVRAQYLKDPERKAFLLTEVCKKTGLVKQNQTFRSTREVLWNSREDFKKQIRFEKHVDDLVDKVKEYAESATAEDMENIQALLIALDSAKENRRG